MKNKIDNILMGLLWLIAAVLGTCFWFNTQFGFNIFSGAHWRHLAYMQANQQPIKPMFYISLVLAVIISIVVLYILLRPRKPNVSEPKGPTHPQSKTLASPNTVSPVPATSGGAPASPAPGTTTQNPSPQPALTPSAHDVTVPPISSMSRPMRLNISPSARVTPPSSAPALNLPNDNNNTQPLPQIPPTSPSSNTAQEWPELREIFESTGYVIKPNIFIDGTRTSLVAIGADENLWVGAVGVPTSGIKSIIERFERIFEETLEDIIINVSGFVISAPDASSPLAPEILTFDTPGSLREYMKEHRNPELDADEQENFDAYSNYISTVLDYIGKL